MDELHIYVLVILITIAICSGFGVFYVSKVILCQRKIENEIIKTVRKVVEK